ncbi:hypothetical protein, partial [Blastomonas sp. CCH3-A3]|uniref:hypothetical protein n=1 Tax=Blastomonas sp. CCH3-A3 TaxID=1768733 RepID=UPI001E31B5CE
TMQPGDHTPNYTSLTDVTDQTSGLFATTMQNRSAKIVRHHASCRSRKENRQEHISNIFQQVKRESALTCSASDDDMISEC